MYKIFTKVQLLLVIFRCFYQIFQPTYFMKLSQIFITQ